MLTKAFWPRVLPRCCFLESYQGVVTYQVVLLSPPTKHQARVEVRVRVSGRVLVHTPVSRTCLICLYHRPGTQKMESRVHGFWEVCSITCKDNTPWDEVPNWDKWPSRFSPNFRTEMSFWVDLLRISELGLISEPIFSNKGGHTQRREVALGRSPWDAPIDVSFGVCTLSQLPRKSAWKFVHVCVCYVACVAVWQRFRIERGPCSWIERRIYHLMPMVGEAREIEREP